MLLDRTAAIASPRPGLLLAEHEGSPRQIAYQRLILATGARELFIPFPGWTLPGVVGPGGILSMTKTGWPVKGKRVVIAGSGPLLFATADSLRKSGATIVCIAEQAPSPSVTRFVLSLCGRPAKLRQAIALRFRQRAVPYHCGVWPIAAEGKESVRSVKLTNGRDSWTETCDLFACGFGLNPTTSWRLRWVAPFARALLLSMISRPRASRTFTAQENLPGLGARIARWLKGKSPGTPLPETPPPRWLFSPNATPGIVFASLSRMHSNCVRS